MRIINTGKARKRIEGFGYIMPGETKDVPDEIGRQLCIKGSPFRKVRKLPRKKFYPETKSENIKPKPKGKRRKKI